MMAKYQSSQVLEGFDFRTKTSTQADNATEGPTKYKLLLRAFEDEDMEPKGRQRGPGKDKGGLGNRGGMTAGKGLRQRQGNTQGPSKDPAKLEILKKCATMPKTYLLSTVCSSVPHSQAAEEAILHLYKERKRPTPMRRRLSRTQAPLGRINSGVSAGVGDEKCGVLWGCPPTPHSVGDPPSAPHVPVCCCCQMN